MKRFITLFILSLALLLVPVATSFAQSTVAQGTVTAWYLNVRTSPFANAERITTVSRGYTAGVIGKNDTSTWYQIILPGGSGWVHGNYLSVTNAHTVPVTYTVTPAPVVAGGYVNTGRLNIRSFPSPYNNVPITNVARNTTLTIFARNPDSSWYKVTTSSNVQGWVRSTYVNVTSGNINDLPIITEEVPAPVPQFYAQGYVNTGALNIRTVPSPFFNAPITSIRMNTTVNIIGRTNDQQWYQVNVNGTIGWVRGRYISITNGAVINAPVTW